MFNILRNAATAAGEVMEQGRQTLAAFAPASFNPQSPTQVVEIPAAQYQGKFHVTSQGQFFSLQQQGGSQVTHIMLYSAPAATYYSLFRGESTEDGKLFTADLFRAFERNGALFDRFETMPAPVRASLVGALHEHQTWGPLHLAAATDQRAYFQQLDPSLLNTSRDSENGALALHVATAGGHLELADVLMGLGAEPGTPDARGNAALHYAAKANSPEMVHVLAKRSDWLPSGLKARNAAGQTAAFYAVQWQSWLALEALLKVGANADELAPDGRSLLAAALIHGNELNAVKCIRVLSKAAPQLAVRPDAKGSTPLHSLPQKEILAAMLSGVGRRVSLSVADGAGATPLHLAAKARRLDAAIQLLSYGAPVDVKDGNGATPLHLAAASSNGLFQIFVLFGADALAKDGGGKTAREILEKRDAALAKQLDDILRQKPTEPAKEPPVSEFAQAMALSAGLARWHSGAPGTPLHLLSLDGGGIRGLVLIQTLRHIQSKLPQGQSVMDHFGWVAGTSTGAILALALAKGLSLLECQALYFRFKDAVFAGIARPYNTAVLERFLKDELTEESTMADIPKPRLTVTTVEAAFTPMTLRLLRNYTLPLSRAENEALGFGEPKNMTLWKAARCSSAAPTFFTSVDEKFVDGGMVANNPSMDLLCDLQSLNTAAEYAGQQEASVRPGCLLSLGTGWAPPKEMGMQLGALEGLPTSFAEAWKSMGMRHLEAVKTLAFSFVDQDIKLDEKDDIRLVQMMWETELFLVSQAPQVDALVHFLQKTSAAK